MEAASTEEEPVVNFHVGIPEGAIVTNNLIGRHYPIGPKRVDI
jgi:hypothetical protein